MDKGAHFRKCDFQVHTPRDPNWSGKDAVSENDRKAYAEELIQSCRTKGLDAIAITDHHDFCFVPHIRRAAQEELDSRGQAVPAGKRIIVFPGLELTLTAPTCQALLILDANFPDNLLASVLTALSVTPAPSTDSKAATVERIPQNVVNDLADLYERLNSHQELRGRFIVFPNVSETGHGTLLRSGFSNYYKTMPCVGGYVDGAVSQFGKGNLAIIRGENRDYGFKPTAVFQTSDNRRRDHANLGKYTTWVKWSEPTAEALRQACLAKESRLSQEEPQLPSRWITAMSVSHSKFLGRVELEFNQQCNAIIGGRGTGKSTILEYLRWGLCDQPADDADFDLAPVQRRRKKLIDDTLQKVDGEIIITFVVNSVRHILKRSSKNQEVLLKIGESEFAPATEQEIRNLFPVQAYSQKQLSSVGVRVEELKRFVELPLKQSLDKIKSDIRDAETKSRTTYSKFIRKTELQTEIAKYAKETKSLNEQLEKLRKGLKGLSETDQNTINAKTEYDNEEIIIESLKNRLARANELVNTLDADFKSEVEDQEEEELDVINKSLLKSIRTKYAHAFGGLRKQIDGMVDLFKPASLKDLSDEVRKWDKAKQDFEKQYEGAKARAKANQQQLKQIRDTEKRIAEVKKLQMTNRNALTAIGDPEGEYAKLRTAWDELHTSKIKSIEEQCQQFSSLSNGLIRATMKGSLDVDALKQRFKVAFAGLNIKEQKIEELCQCVLSAADPMSSWNEILAELEKLALHPTDGSGELPKTRVMDRCGFIETEKRRLATGFDASKWIELSVVELEFNPIFEYCTNKETDEYISFADASAGQQATALLTVLLNQPGAPLVIDQPEDDVDSKMSPDIVQRIWNSKTQRQLVFASHNANFVVNGDAELVACCDYVRAGDQTGGQIKFTGAIDNAQIREEITAVTEGGKEAFKLRMEKYGF